MRTIVTAAAALGLLAGPALAQYDSAGNRGLNQANSLNRSMLNQEQSQSAAQQQQFETNALRNQITQPAPPPLVPPSVTTAPPIGRP